MVLGMVLGGAAASLGGWLAIKAQVSKAYLAGVRAERQSAADARAFRRAEAERERMVALEKQVRFVDQKMRGSTRPPASPERMHRCSCHHGPYQHNERLCLEPECPCDFRREERIYSDPTEVKQ